MEHALKTKEGNRLFGSRRFYSEALAIALPIMLQGLIQSMVSLVDNYMVADLGDVAMSGVNITGQILFAFMVVFNSAAMAGGIFLTQYFGAKDAQGMKQAFRFKLIAGIMIFIPFMLACKVFPRQLLPLLMMRNTQKGQILDVAVEYIRIVFWMGIPMMISICIASSIRDMGRVKLPLIISGAATLLNTLFNWLLIYGKLGFPRLEIRGAAIATVIARWAECTAFIIVCIREKPDFIVGIRDLFKVDLKLFQRILHKSTVVIVCDLVWVTAENVTTAIYNGRGGADVVSGMAAGFGIANLYFVAFGGVYSATEVIIGKTLGTGELELARKQKTWLLSGSVVFGLLMIPVSLAGIPLVPVVFGHLSESAIDICRTMVMAISLLMPVWIIGQAQRAIARAGGDTAMGAWADIVVTALISMPLLLLLAGCSSVGPVMICVAGKGVDIIKLVFFHFWLKKEKWLKNLTEVSA